MDVASLHEIWVLCGLRDASEIHIGQILDLASQCAQVAIAAVYEGNLVMSLSTPYSLRETEQAMDEILRQVLPDNPNATLVRCSGLSNTTNCREAYLLILENLEDAKRIFPHKQIFLQGELELAAKSRKRISEGEAATLHRTMQLSTLQSDREYPELLNTVCTYLLDCDSSVSRTAQMLFLHKNTIKYRLQRVSDLLGFRIGKMPETIDLYRNAAIYRLLNENS